ncbi:hypothetical protein Tco_0649218 [Tanacetum coccineum]
MWGCSIAYYSFILTSIGHYHYYLYLHYTIILAQSCIPRLTHRLGRATTILPDWCGLERDSVDAAAQTSQDTTIETRTPKFCTRHHDAQKDRVAVRAEIEILRRERLAYEQEGMETRQALERLRLMKLSIRGRVISIRRLRRARPEWQRQNGHGESHQINPSPTGTPTPNEPTKLLLTALTSGLSDLGSYCCNADAQAPMWWPICRRISAKLALMCLGCSPEEVRKIEKVYGGLPDMIPWLCKGIKIEDHEEVIDLLLSYMEAKNHAYDRRQAERKRKNDDRSTNIKTPTE